MKLTAVENELTNPEIVADEDDLNYEPKLDHDFAYLAGIVASADAKPTAVRPVLPGAQEAARRGARGVPGHRGPRRRGFQQDRGIAEDRPRRPAAESRGRHPVALEELRKRVARLRPRHPFSFWFLSPRPPAVDRERQPAVLADPDAFALQHFLLQDVVPRPARADG